jgi:hypothetical protein
MAAGAIPRSDLPELDHPVIREEIESRLRQCGFELASSAFSDHYGVRLSPGSASEVLDTPSNLGLGANACALLTILWAKLALQKRTVAQTQVTPAGQGELIAEQRRDRAREFQPSVRYETLAREFGSKLGGRTRLLTLLGQLRRLKFITYRRLDDIQAGPLLELAIDGEKMIGFIRSRVLDQYIEGVGMPATLDVSSEHGEARLIDTLSQSEEPLSIAQLEARTGLARRELKRMLKLMREDRQVEVVGGGAKTTYRLLQPQL